MTDAQEPSHSFDSHFVVMTPAEFEPEVVKRHAPPKHQQTGCSGGSAGTCVQNNVTCIAHIQVFSSRYFVI